MTTLNRVRIKTHPPLEPFQAWIPFDPSNNIRSFKTSIIDLLNSNHSSSTVDPNEISIELDGFAFLDQSLCSLINPAHDLIDVKTLRNPIQSNLQQPNRQSTIKTAGAEKVNIELPQSKPTATQSSTSNHEKTQKNPTSVPNQPAPPGQGKPSTKARNQRKKLKKIREREQKALSQAVDSSNPVLSNPNQPPTITTNLIQPQIPISKTVSNSSQKATTIKVQSIQNHTQNQTGATKIDRPHNTQVTDDKNETSSDDGSSSSSSSSSSSESESDSDLDSSESASSSSSSAPSQHPTTKDSGPATQRIVPIVQDPQLTMLSLSNKNKRKNLKRKSHSDQDSQPQKIVFDHHEPADRIAASPSYIPPSPNQANQIDTSPLLMPPNIKHLKNTWNDEPFDEVVYAEDSFLTTTIPSHGPPPSIRDPSLIPPNAIITSVNVLNPYWTPGQIGTQPDWTAHPFNDPVSSCSKKTRQNRKKNLKRRQRAARSRMLDQQQQAQLENQCDDNEDESDGQQNDRAVAEDDIEAAYAEFLASGGHKNCPNVARDPHSNKKSDLANGRLVQIQSQWNELEKLDNTNSVIGSKVAIRTVEISLETFTPETMVYWGTLIGTNDSHVALRLDPACVPEPEPTRMEDESEEESKKEAVDDDERMGDVKEAMRAQQRNALLHELWGHSPGVRDWEWSAIIDARKL